MRFRRTLLGAAIAAFAGPALAQSYLLADPSGATEASKPEPAAGCHCYRDWTYLADRPAAADPYILATSRSSLL